MEDDEVAVVSIGIETRRLGKAKNLQREGNSVYIDVKLDDERLDAELEELVEDGYYGAGAYIHPIVEVGTGEGAVITYGRLRYVALIGNPGIPKGMVENVRTD